MCNSEKKNIEGVLKYIYCMPTSLPAMGMYNLSEGLVASGFKKRRVL